jgi:hypothetical protein
MHPIQLELNRLVDAGLPGVFAYIEDADGASQFYTAGVADLATRKRMAPSNHYPSWLHRISVHPIAHCCFRSRHADS